MFLKLIGYFYKEVSVYRKVMQKVAVPRVSNIHCPCHGFPLFNT